MIKIKFNTSHVIQRMQKSINRIAGTKGKIQTKIFNTTEYGPFVERGWGGPTSSLSKPGGKESFKVNFSPRFMMRNSLAPTNEFFMSHISGVLKNASKAPIKDLEQLLESVTVFGLSEVTSRTPMQFWLDKEHLIDDWQHTEVQQVK